MKRMAGYIMSRCPFWSTTKERVECYKECPMLASELLEGQGGDQCIFNECAESSNVHFRDIVKDDYNFLDLSIYDEDKKLNINY
jgi:hypothetical protein